MVRVKTGDIFKSKAQTLVNTVNCVGVMGKGLALEFKRRFPDMFKDYQERCARREVRMGRPYLYKPLLPPWILNFPTKEHWRSVSRLKDIVQGLEYLLAHYKEWGITSLAVPPLGCGQGQLEWRIVGPTLYRYLSRLDIPVELYAPFDTPYEELQPEFLDDGSRGNQTWLSPPGTTRIEPAWVALVEILKRIEQQPYHWPVGRTVFQKMVFVATKEGIPTGLHFKKGSYGPFSPELKKLITRLVNHGLIREERLGRMFSVQVGPTFEDARKADQARIEQWEPIIEKTADLFVRVKTEQAEMTATVLYAANELMETKKEQPTEVDVLHSVLQWKQRRRPPLEKSEVASVIRNLAALDWLKVKPSGDLPLSEEVP
ncbi:MAG: macro domain-containing protein [Bacillota bacterium]